MIQGGIIQRLIFPGREGIPPTLWLWQGGEEIYGGRYERKIEREREIITLTNLAKIKDKLFLLVPDHPASAWVFLRLENIKLIEMR